MLRRLACVFHTVPEITARCRETHTKETSLPEAGADPVLATVTTTDRLKPVRGCCFDLVETSEMLSLWQTGQGGVRKHQLYRCVLSDCG